MKASQGGSLESRSNVADTRCWPTVSDGRLVTTMARPASSSGPAAALEFCGLRPSISHGPGNRPQAMLVRTECQLSLKTVDEPVGSLALRHFIHSFKYFSPAVRRGGFLRQKRAGAGAVISLASREAHTAWDGIFVQPLRPRSASGLTPAAQVALWRRATVELKHVGRAWRGSFSSSPPPSACWRQYAL